MVALGSYEISICTISIATEDFWIYKYHLKIKTWASLFYFIISGQKLWNFQDFYKYHPFFKIGII